MKKNDEKSVKRRKTKLISVPKKKKVNKQKEIKEVKTKQEPKKKYISKKRLRRRRKFMLITSLVLIIAITSKNKRPMDSTVPREREVPM